MSITSTGLDVIVRYSLPEVRNSSGNIDHVGPMVTYLYPDADERNWSWSYLRGQFKLKNLDDLFALYRRRIQHSLFTVMLFINILYSILRIITFFVLIKDGNILPSVSFHLLSIIFSATCLLAAIRGNGSLFTRSNLVPTITSCILLILIEISDFSFILFNLEFLGHDQLPRLSPTFTIIVASYVFLPFPRLYQTMLAGICITALDLTVSALIIEDPQENVRQLAADSILYLTANIFGTYKIFLDELNQRRSFLDHRRCIESSIRLEYEEGREVKLMESILPNYIAQDVLKELRMAVKNFSYTTNPTKHAHRPFSSLFLKTHQDVSILFSDIVNFTKLAATLSTEDLVELLNELFGRFDDIAKDHDCMRIRILGDCYIAVSGIPDHTPKHARNCVTMALDIINVISDLREERKVNVGMRIGVHSGKVMCGLLGMRKWQFDIWSGDVNVANILEQTGEPGLVHISNVTLNLLNGSWLYRERGLVRDNIDKYRSLKQQGISTFLVVCEQLPEREEPHVTFDNTVHVGNGETHARYQQHKQRRHSKTQKRGSSLLVDNTKRRRTVLETSSLVQFQNMIKNVDEKMEEAIKGMALSKRDQWLRKSHVKPLSLRFRDRSWEIPFVKQLDPLFKYYLLFAAFIFAIIFTITMLIFFDDNVPLVAAYAVVCPILLSIVYISWHNFFMNLRIKKDKDGFPPAILPQSNQHKSGFRGYLDKASQTIAVSVKVRLILIFIVTIIITTFALVDVSACIFTDDLKCLLVPTKNETCLHTDNSTKAILDPRYITQNVALTLTVIAAFIRIHFLIKLTMYTIVLLIYITVLAIGSHDGVHWESVVPGQPYQKGFPWEQLVSITFLGLCLHLMDRQSEYLSRLDYSWKNQLKDEQDKAILSRMVNKILLQNILPVHVADIYLNENMQDNQNLYHEEYQCVAVMFASIPDFADFYKESEATDNGKNCLLVLGEIIKDIDSLLYRSEFLNVEKIKVIGSTYLAAVGLRPGRKNSSEETMSPHDDQEIATTMVKFAEAMMDTLETYNMTAWEVGFQFRIGIEMGYVTAGIIGAQKPLYDIWGDTVNVASRMESHGEIGRIHVTDKFAAVLQRSKIPCECRGMIDIKGKGFLTTYFVITQRDYRPETTHL